MKTSFKEKVVSAYWDVYNFVDEKVLPPIKFVVVIAGLVTLIFTPILSLVVLVSRGTCINFAVLNNLPYKFNAFNGCLVQYNGWWISPSSIIELIK